MSSQIEQIRAEIERQKEEAANEIEKAKTFEEVTHYRGELSAYFTLGALVDKLLKEHPVPAEERKILPKLREYLAKATPEELDTKYHELEHLLAPKDEDADKAAEEACAKCPISGRCFVEDKGRKDACDYLRGVKAGIAYERERLMKEAVEIAVSNVGILQMGSILTDRGISAGGTIKLIILK